VSDHLTADQRALVDDFDTGLMAGRGRPLMLDTARRRHLLLESARRAVEVAGEVLGAQVLTLLVEDAGWTVRHLEEQAAEAAADRRKREAAEVARLAAELDGWAVEMDGGPSDPLIGPAEWYEIVERWSREGAS
jgi:hypothetical protein